MKTLFAFFLIIWSICAAAQSPQLRSRVDSIFTDSKSIKPELTREILEYFQSRQGKGARFELINSYPLDSNRTRVQIACMRTDTLVQVLTLDLKPGSVDLPLFYDTRNWNIRQTGSIRYHYDHDFDAKAAKAFDAANHRIAGKLGLPAENFDFYLSDNYQQIMQWLGLTYDRQSAGQTRDGFNTDNLIFAIQHNEDFSHDLVHYYVYKVRKGPRNLYAEEGVAYYWGNAYYPDAQGNMIGLDRLKPALRQYLQAHPDADLLALFRQNPRGLFGPAKEVSFRSTLSAIVAEAIEKENGTAGIIRLLNCGPGEASYFTATRELVHLDTLNFNNRLREWLKN